MTTQSHAEKIFCIGLSKTGTTSLAAALRQLGYTVRDNLGVSRYIPGDLSCVDEAEIEAHDAFTDTPIPSLYRELDARYPNAKFILTIREKGPWLKSCRKQFTQRHAKARHDAINELFIDMYGSAWFDEEKFSAGYDRFVEGVKDYFKDRPDDLLILDLCDGDDWEPLCRFLHKPIPDAPIPVTNVTKIQWIKAEDVADIARKAGANIPTADSLKHSSGSAPKGMLGRLGDKARNTVIARRRARLPNILDTTYQTIVDNLKSIDASIPVLSEKTKDTPYSDRKQWSHAWLIDTFKGKDLLLRGDNGFSINIALVENGNVRMGVVYFPATDTVYYTKNGSVSYKQSGADEALQLGHGDSRSDASSATAETTQGNAPLTLCKAAEGDTQQPYIRGQFREWEIAAANAILNGSGKRIKIPETEQEPKYNKETLMINI
ncbi:hypothetical protein Tel_13585 [Candidatus Tenderia electrophaga]|uniref:Sulfotransferase domain-containing protein n=1 Tax=Candidatus Tenderia electrophaga TaxID=1748243 RepID=A0A0S2TFY3_9GAMM|nr:hypothetical protein Tel_13585 [Candidatus Tenderia electrophaga]